VFRTRATKLEGLLKAAGFKVVMNPEKARKGTFEVRVVGQPEPAVSLIGMPRPFKLLRELDIEDLAQKIISGK